MVQSSFYQDGAIYEASDPALVVDYVAQAAASATAAATSASYASLFDFGVFAQGTTFPNEVLARYTFRAEVTFPAGLNASRASSAVASTGTAVFSLKRNGVTFGTLTFTTSATGVFASTSPVVFSAGDTLTVVAPASADATLYDISITLAGSR